MEKSVDTITTMSGGYPYFIQFICREVYDSFLQKLNNDQEASVPVEEIENKLDTDFFAGRWARATDRQRELLYLIAKLDNCDHEFTVQEVAGLSKKLLEKSFGGSQVNQMLCLKQSRYRIQKQIRKILICCPTLMGKFIQRQAG